LTSPTLTGTLELNLYQGAMDTVHRLLDLPNGLHFRKLDLLWRDKEDPWCTVKLVVECSETLEYLEVTHELDGAIHYASLGWAGDLFDFPSADEPDGSGPIDLSKATKLKDVVFNCRSLSSEWAAEALETITSRHRDLQRISIHIPDLFSQTFDEDGVTIEWGIGPDPGMQWLDLDRALARFWDSHSIRPTVVHPWTKNQKEEMRNWVGGLLPEVMKRGIIDLVEEPGGFQ